MGLGAQAVFLGRLHLARGLVVAMTMAMAQHLVDSSCHFDGARSKRPAVSRKLDAEKGLREGRG